MALQQGSSSNRSSPRGIVRFDNLGFFGTANPGWRGRSAGAFCGRSTPGYLLSGLQPEEPGTDAKTKGTGVVSGNDPRPLFVSLVLFSAAITKSKI